jgi:integrase
MSSTDRRRPVGIEERHSKTCRGRTGARCDCTPTYQATVWDNRAQKRIRKTFTTRTAAKQWRSDAQAALRAGRLSAPTRTTLNEAAAAWLDGARRGEVRNRSGDPYKPSAIRAYEQNLRLRVLPAYGARRLGDVTRADHARLLERRVGAGTSPSTVMTTILPLRAIYRRAVDLGDVDVNPTLGLRMPAVRGGRDRIAAPDEAARLLDALDPADRPMWATAMYAGLRRGELTALRWDDVDLARGVIDVRRGWDAIEGEIAPKSKEGKRAVPIPAALRDYLVDARLRAGDDPAARVFAGPSAVRSAIDRARARWADAGLDAITLHECRHTYASLMIAAGVNAKALSTFMGHANISITLDRYGHLMPGSEAEAAGLLDAYLDRARAAGAGDVDDLAPADDPTSAPTSARTSLAR